MKITVADINSQLIEYVQVEIAKINLDIDTYIGNIFNVKADGVVSPANSFGFMDGGIDGVYTAIMGQQVQTNVQQAIDFHFDGEILVGQALIVATNYAENFPYLIAAPTMRVPKRIADYADIRLATRAAVKTAFRYNLNSLVIPGMGTGVGSVPFEYAARNIVYGIDDALNRKPKPKFWREAWNDHYKWNY